MTAIGPIRTISAERAAAGAKPALPVRGMFGIGDCIFQRAVIRELMRTNEVHLDSYYADMYRDLQERGLHLSIVQDRGRIRDDANRSAPQSGGVRPRPPLISKKEQVRITYDRAAIHKYGSILAAMFASAGLCMPREPDFSIPIRAEWIAAWRSFLAKRKIVVDRPLAVYRPVVLNNGWTAPARAPDPETYADLFAVPSLRKFFWVSIANLSDKGGSKEWIVGRHQKVDLALEAGELDFKTMIGLFASARLVFANPGFVPVLAHACRVPVAIVYGANESFRTTNSVGRHLSPTLAIDLDRPCEHHEQHCRCSKQITLAPARRRLEEFAETILTKNHAERERELDLQVNVTSSSPKVLIFGTVYADTEERMRLTQLWARHHRRLNPDCDLLLVDSASPMFWHSDGSSISEAQTPISVERCSLTSFPDNIGHLSRNGPGGASAPGRDGWGRAFCRGLEMAIEKGYDYVVHIEGDSLFKYPVGSIISRMMTSGHTALSVPVLGTKRLETGWVETGLIFFSVPFLRRTKFVENYAWEKRLPSPTPERVIHAMLSAHGAAFKMESWGAYRGDKNQIDESNITRMDWVTHVRRPDGMDNVELFEKFSAACVFDGELKGLPEVEARMEVAKVKINLGCGTNRLEGWQNHDSDINIERKLPFASDSADFIFAEHVVEHVDYYAALRFFKEAARVLKPGGVIRITVPSLEQIYDRGDDPEYVAFVHDRGWAPSRDLRGAIHAILHCHGHRTAWSESILRASLYYSGFRSPSAVKTGWSRYPELKGVEGHWRVIGEKFNSIESISVEAEVDK